MSEPKDNPFRQYVPKAYDFAKRARDLRNEVAHLCDTDADQMEYLSEAVEALDKAESFLMKNYFELQIVSAG